MKRIVKETHTTEREVEVQLPYYSKNGNYFYMVISEGKHIEVDQNGCMQGVRIMDDICEDRPFETACVEITEQEFKDALYGKFDEIRSLVDVKPAPNEI